MPDVVALEATRLQDRPWAPEIAAWLTGSGPPRHAGELSIIEWLRDYLPQPDQLVLVIYEDRRLPKMMAQEDLGPSSILLTTHSFLEFAEETAMIDSAEVAWETIASAAPTVPKASIPNTRKQLP